MFRCGCYDGRASKPLSLQQMTSTTPMDKADGPTEEDQSPEKGVPAGGEPWWRPWLGPAVAATIISTLLIALVMVGVTAFNSLKGDVRDLSLDIRTSETRLREDVKEFRLESKADLENLRTEIKGDMKEFRAEIKRDMADLKAETREDMKEFRAEVKADNRVLNDKLDRLLEIVLMDKS